MVFLHPPTRLLSTVYPTDSLLTFTDIRNTFTSQKIPSRSWRPWRNVIRKNIISLSEPAFCPMFRWEERPTCFTQVLFIISSVLYVGAVLCAVFFFFLQWDNEKLTNEGAFDWKERGWELMCNRVCSERSAAVYSAPLQLCQWIIYQYLKQKTKWQYKKKENSCKRGFLFFRRFVDISYCQMRGVK